MEKEYLNHLLEKRIKETENRSAIDEEILDCYGCMGCVVYVNLYNSFELINSFGIIAFMQKMQELKIICNPIMNKHHGEIIKVDGGSFMVYFKKVNMAMSAFIEVDEYLSLYNKSRGELTWIQLCFGVGYGELIKINGNDIFGAEVYAARELAMVNTVKSQDKTETSILGGYMTDAARVQLKAEVQI